MDETIASVTEDLPAPVAILDGDGMIHYLNEAARSVVALGTGELENRTVFDFVAPDQREELRLRLAFEATLSALVGSPANHQSLWRIHCLDGSAIAVRCESRAMVGSDGETYLRVVFVPDEESPSLDAAERLAQQLVVMADYLTDVRVAAHYAQEQINTHSYQLNAIGRTLETIAGATALAVSLLNDYTPRDPQEAT